MITHAETGYSCYNPLQIPQHDAQGGARIFITCTMVNSFSGNNHKARPALLGSWDDFQGASQTRVRYAACFKPSAWTNTVAPHCGSHCHPAPRILTRRVLLMQEPKYDYNNMVFGLDLIAVAGR